MFIIALLCLPPFLPPSLSPSSPSFFSLPPFLPSFLSPSYYLPPLIPPSSHHASRDKAGAYPMAHTTF